MTRRFLGTGWKFPIRVMPGGGLAYSSGDEKIQESIWIILGTAQGERQMLPRFGCGIHDAVFAPLDQTTRGLLAQNVRQALTTWEPRVDVLNVRVDSGADENVLLIRVDYRIRSTNTFHNLVYPYYITEGLGA